MLKVGIFVEDISYGGGLEIVSSRLYQAFCDRNIDVCIITLRQKTHKYKFLGKLHSFDFDVKDLRSKKIRTTVAKELKSLGFTHIIFQTGAPYSFFSNNAFYKAVKSSGIKTYVVFHTSPKTVVVRSYHQGELFFEFVLRCLKTWLYNIPRSLYFFFNSSDAVDSFVTLSRGTRKELQKYFRKDSVIIPNYFEYLDFSFDLTKKKKEFVYIGRMDKEQKNIFYLINAWKNVKDKNGWKFIVIGPDSNDKDILKALNENEIETVFYADNKKVLEILRESSVLLLASIYEGFPTVVLEAVANANAVITTRYDGFSDEIIRNNKNGFVIDNKLNSKEFTKAIEKLIDDKALLLSMQKKSIDLYQEYTRTDVVELWKKEFEK